MTKTCPITGKNTKTAGGYSNRIRATKFNPTGTKRRKANLQKKKIYVPELGYDGLNPVFLNEVRTTTTGVVPRPMVLSGSISTVVPSEYTIAVEELPG